MIMTLAMAAVAAGCGGSGSAYEGVYSVTTWTENDASCAAEGASVLENKTETFFYIKLENFLGTKFLNVKFCDDVGDCQTIAGDDGTINIGTFSFESGNDDGWSAGYYSGFAGQDNVCDGNWVDTTLSGDAATSIRLAVRRTPAGGFQPDNDGFCEDKDGEQAAEGQPCGELEVVTATRVGDL